MWNIDVNVIMFMNMIPFYSPVTYHTLLTTCGLQVYIDTPQHLRIVYFVVKKYMRTWPFPDITPIEQINLKTSRIKPACNQAKTIRTAMLLIGKTGQAWSLQMGNYHGKGNCFIYIVYLPNDRARYLAMVCDWHSWTPSTYNTGSWPNGVPVERK